MFMQKIFYDLPIKLESVYDHITRQLTKNVYLNPQLIKTLVERLHYSGGSLWGKIDINIKNVNWASFKMQYKKTLIESYES